MSCKGFKPSSPRWFSFPGPSGRGFFCLRFPIRAAVVAALLGLGGCSSPGLEEHPVAQPEMRPEVFFDGFLTAHGVIKDWRGGVARQFNADIDACWRDGVGTLDESFVFDDGETQQRVWTLTPDGDRTYVATAGDVVGNGTARWQGSAFYLDYTLRIELEDGPIDVRIDDRMYRVSDRVLINQSKLKKFGLGVGEILLTIIRHPDTAVECDLN